MLVPLSAVNGTKSLNQRFIGKKKKKKIKPWFKVVIIIILNIMFGRVRYDT